MEITNSGSEWEQLRYAAPLRRAEDPICAGGGGKGCKSFPWKNNPNTPLTISRAMFLLKASTFSPLAKHNVLLYPFLLCQQVLLSSRNKDFSGNGHADSQKLLERKTLYCFGQRWEKWAVECKQPHPCRTSPSLERPRDGDQPPRAKVTAQAIPRTKSKVPLEFGNGDLKALQGNPKAALPSLCPPVSFGFLGCMHAASLMTITLVFVILHPGSLERA